MGVKHMLTTVDNPYDPFEDFKAWFAFDAAHGYHTPGYLARVVVDSDELSEAENSQAIEDAIDYICELNVLGIYRKVSKVA